MLKVWRRWWLEVNNQNLRYFINSFKFFSFFIFGLNLCCVGPAYEAIDFVCRWLIREGQVEWKNSWVEDIRPFCLFKLLNYNNWFLTFSILLALVNAYEYLGWGQGVKVSISASYRSFLDTNLQFAEQYFSLKWLTIKKLINQLAIGYNNIGYWLLAFFYRRLQKLHIFLFI